MRRATILHRSLMLATAMAGGLALAQPAEAATTVLDFSGNICGPTGTAACSDGIEIGQNYGDSAAVNVSYRSISTTTGLTAEPYLKFWQSSYGDLVGVVWGGSDAVNFQSEIVFTPTAGFEVSLTSFQAGCYLDRASCRSLPYTAESIGGTAIASGTLTLPAGGHADAAIASAYFTDGIVLRWGPDGYDGGFDNITFDVRAISPGGGTGGAVPEPETWALMALGFGLTGAAVRRRRRGFAPFSA